MTQRQIVLPGSLKSDAPGRLCQGSCGQQRAPEGGVQISAKRWICGACWPTFLAKHRG